MKALLLRVFGALPEDPLPPELQAAKNRITEAFSVSQAARADNAQALDALSAAVDRRRARQGEPS